MYGYDPLFGAQVHPERGVLSVGLRHRYYDDGPAPAARVAMLLAFDRGFHCPEDRHAFWSSPPPNRLPTAVEFSGAPPMTF